MKTEREPFEQGAHRSNGRSHATHSTMGRRIGELDAAAGVTVDTLRYYERAPLLPKPSRTRGGFRVYAPHTVQRVQFMKQAQRSGLSLREIRQLVGSSNSRCASVRAVITRRLTDADARVRDLRLFRKRLRAALKECDEALRRSKNPDYRVASHLATNRPTTR
jgi:DNA-binding transcriptional MerR regulator